MGKPVEECRGHLGVAEDARPFAEVEIGGDQDRGAFVEVADEMEEKLPAGLASPCIGWGPARHGAGNPVQGQARPRRFRLPDRVRLTPGPSRRQGGGDDYLGDQVLAG